jgi:Rieske Fe-S protein
MGVCKHAGCTKQPIFNTLGKKERLYCAAHKLPGMVNVKSKVCQHAGGTKQPSFNTPGERAGRFCVAHKLGGMVDLRAKRTADVKDGFEALMLLAGNKRPKHNE